MTKYDLYRISSDFKRLCCDRFRFKSAKGELACDKSCPLLKISKEIKKTVIDKRSDVRTGEWEYKYAVDEIEVKRCVYDVDGDSAVFAIANEEAVVVIQPIANEEAEDKPETKEENK